MVTVTQLLTSGCIIPVGYVVKRTALDASELTCVDNNRLANREIIGSLCGITFESVSIGYTGTIRFELHRANDDLLLDSLQACFDNTGNVVPEGYVYNPPTEEF